MFNVRTIVIAAWCLTSTPLALADKYAGEDRGRPTQPPTLDATWKRECSACHLPYAPSLLPAASWGRLMAELSNHFGVDASLEPAQRDAILSFLKSNASNRWRATTAPLRITETAWFKSKHNAGEIAPAVWSRASVKSPANCAACHPQAEKGDFSERQVRIAR